MKFLFYFGHPAQYLALRETIRRLAKNDAHQLTVLIKTKDVLEELIAGDNLPYTNILPCERGPSRAAMLLSMFQRLALMLPILLRKKPDLLIGTDPTLAQLGKLLNIHRVTVLEDDYPVIRNMARLTYPFTQTILCPSVCGVGRWEAKKIGYEGYMKLGYLHPAIFTPDPGVPIRYGLNEPYVLVRLSRLRAHHDIGARGINAGLLDQLIGRIERAGYRVLISSEGTLLPEYASYRLQIRPADMHHMLAHARLLLSDSQSMSVEAAMLGVPSIRYSDFAGRISVLNELEHRYGLTFGIPVGQNERLLAKLNELLTSQQLLFQEKRQQMLTDKINVTAFWVWFFENYPASRQQFRQNEGQPQITIR